MKAFILDDTFTAKTGHNASYNFAIAQELVNQGYEVSILAQRDAPAHATQETKGLIKPAFARYAAEVQLKRLSFLPHRLHLLIRLACGNLGHLFDLLLNVSPFVSNGDLVIVSMYHSYHATAYSIWLKCLTLQSKRIYIRLIFHNMQSFDLLRYEMKLFNFLGKSQDVCFFSQTQALADQFFKNCRLQTVTLPFPYVQEEISCTSGHDQYPIWATYVGVALQAKGFDILVKALEASSNLLNSGKVCFLVQNNILYADPLLSKSSQELLELSTRFPQNLRVVQGPLTDREYKSILQETDLMILPHRASGYRYARSGVYIEALTLGIPVITSDGTFMAQELQEFGSGIIFIDGDEESLANAIGEAVDDFKNLKAKAISNKKNWAEIHNPRNFVKILLSTLS